MFDYLVCIFFKGLTFEKYSVFLRKQLKSIRKGNNTIRDVEQSHKETSSIAEW